MSDRFHELPNEFSAVLPSLRARSMRFHEAEQHEQALRAVYLANLWTAWSNRVSGHVRSFAKALRETRADVERLSRTPRPDIDATGGA